VRHASQLLHLLMESAARNSTMPCPSPQQAGDLAVSAASTSTIASDEKSLAKVYRLGEQKWRRSSKKKNREACAYTATFVAMRQRWRGEAAAAAAATPETGGPM
jgi:hypothetical protein